MKRKKNYITNIIDCYKNIWIENKREIRLKKNETQNSGFSILKGRKINKLWQPPKKIYKEEIKGE